MGRYKPLFESDERHIIDTKHAIDRYAERYSTIYTKEDINAVIRKVMAVIVNKYNDKPCEYGFHSKSTMIGGVISWERYGDARRDTGKNNAVIVTLFPPKRVHTFRDTCANVLVENQILFSLRGKRKFIEQRTKQQKSGLCEVYYFNKEKSFIALFEGNVWDTSIDEYIIVD